MSNVGETGWSNFHVLHSGRLLPLTTNIRLGWKGLLGTNALAYYGRRKFNNIGSDDISDGVGY